MLLLLFPWTLTTDHLINIWKPTLRKPINFPNLKYCCNRSQNWIFYVQFLVQKWHSDKEATTIKSSTGKQSVNGTIFSFCASCISFQRFLVTKALFNYQNQVIILWHLFTYCIIQIHDANKARYAVTPGFKRPKAGRAKTQSAICLTSWKKHKEVFDLLVWTLQLWKTIWGYMNVPMILSFVMTLEPWRLMLL